MEKKSNSNDYRTQRANGNKRKGQQGRWRKQGFLSPKQEFLIMLWYCKQQLEDRGKSVWPREMGDCSGICIFPRGRAVFFRPSTVWRNSLVTCTSRATVQRSSANVQQECWVESCLLCFLCCYLLTHLGKQQNMKQLLGPLLPKWEIHTKPVPLTWPSLDCYSHLGNELLG